MKLQSALLGSVLALFAGGGLSSLGAQSIGVDKSSLAFTGQQGGSAVSQSLTVTGSTSGIAFSTSSSATWLKITPTSGVTPLSLTVTADPAGLPSGTASATVTVAGPNSISIPVTFNVTGASGQGLSVDKSTLTFFGQAGGPSASQTVNVLGATNGAPFTASSNASWLSVSPASGNTPSTLTVTANPAGLGSGTVTGAITISGSNTVQIAVTFQVGAVGVSPQSLQLAYTLNGSFPTAQSLNLTGPAVPFTASASTATGGAWLQIAPTSGTTPSNITVIANTALLPTLTAGTYNGTVTISPTNQAPIAIPVTLTVSAAPSVTVAPVALTFNFQRGQAVPAAQNVTITVTPAQALSFSLNATVQQNPAGKAWLAVPPSISTSAQGTASIPVSVDTSGLPPGTYPGTVTVSRAGNPDVQIAVSLVVSDSPLLNVPSTPVTFTYQIGGAVPAPKPVTVTATSGTPTFSIVPASTPGSWLKVSAASGVVPTPFNISVDPTGLAKGTYSGTVTVTGVGTGNGAQVIPVSLTVTDDPLVTVNFPGCTTTGAAPTCDLVLPFQVGGTNNPGPLTVNVGSSTGAALNYVVAPGAANCGNWLLVNGGVDAVPGSTSNSTNTVSVSVNASGIAAGTTCLGELVVSATVASTNQPVPNSGIHIPVTLKVSSSGQLLSSPAGLTFKVPANGQPSSQSVSLSSTGADQLGYSVVSFATDTGGPWLSVNATAGATPGTLVITATPAALLSPGSYTGSVKLTASGSGGAAANATAAAPFIIPVRLDVTAGTLVGAPTSLTFAQTLGGSAPANQTLNITSNGQALNFVAAASTTDGTGWLSINGTATGTTPGSVAVAVDASKLSPGSYTGTVTVTAQGSSNTLTIPVNLTVAPGSVSATPTSLTFTQVSGGAAPAAQSVAVASTPAGLPFTAAATTKDGGTWLTVTPASGTTNSNVQVSVAAGTLVAGSYTGTVTITSAGATGSPIAIPVSFTVSPSAPLTATPASVSFAYITGTAAPAAATVQIASSGANSTFTVAASTKDGGSWLSATPSSGTTPAAVTIQVAPTALTAGTYTGTVTVTSPNSASPLTIPVTLTVTAIPTPVIVAVGNAASGAAGAVAPGENVTIYGTNIGPNPLVGGVLNSAKTGFDTTAGDTQVFFDGVAAPVIYASAGQTSVMVPYGVAGRTTTTISVAYKGVKSAGVTFNVVNTAPGIYTLNQSGTGPGAILNQNLLTVPTAATPAPKGSTVAVFMTGEGLTIGNVDGAIATTLKNPVASVTATVGGVPATVVYAGTAPGIVNGVMQVNVTIPAGAPSGNAVPIVITVGGVNTQAGVTLAVQ